MFAEEASVAKLVLSDRPGLQGVTLYAKHGQQFQGHHALSLIIK